MTRPVADQLPPLESLDPDTAWEPWRPAADDPWNLRWAAHLFRRAAFGAPPLVPGTSTREALGRAVEAGLEATLEGLFEPGAALADFDRVLDALAPPVSRGGNGDEATRGIQGWWLYRMACSPAPLHERMTLFWHDHFATSIHKVQRADLMLAQNRTLRAGALGRFGDLLREVCRDPAMLIWLDAGSNVKAQPNENLARELMELFTLGVGNYTEKDVREAARALTGRQAVRDRTQPYDALQFQVNDALRDTGPKTILGQTGPWDGDDLLRILLEQEAAARFLARKLYRQFVSEAAPPADALLEPLAAQLRSTGYDVAAVLRTVFRSRLFYSRHAWRRRVKSPVDYVVGLVRSLDGQAGPAALAALADGLGQDLFAPPSVKGWDGGPAWLNTATLITRHNRAWALLNGRPPETPPDRYGRTPTVPAVPLDFPALVQSHAAPDPPGRVGLLLELFLQGDVEPAVRDRLVEYLSAAPPTAGGSPHRLRAAAHTVLLLPEYQLA